MTGTVLPPAPFSAPKGARKTPMIRGSLWEMFGKLLQLLGDVQELGLPPQDTPVGRQRMRSFSPCATLLGCFATPLVTPTQAQGCAELHSVWMLPGQGVPAFFAYCGAQPSASSSLRSRPGSQSSELPWSVATRSVVGGSVGRLSFSRLARTPIRTTRLWVQVAQRSSALAHFRPFSHTSATLMGPDRDSVAPNARWTVPKLPVHGLLFFVEHVLFLILPAVSAQSSVTGTGPAPEATGIVVGELHSFA